MICLDGKDDWIFVTEDTGKCDWDVRPMLWSDFDEALIASEQWIVPGKEENVIVIDYEE